MAGGLSQLLLGQGDGTFKPVPVDTSGLSVPGDAKGLVRMDLNGDGHSDFVVARNDDSTLAFARRAPASQGALAIKILNKTGKIAAIGTRVTCHWKNGRQQAHEIRAGGSYLSQE